MAVTFDSLHTATTLAWIMLISSCMAEAKSSDSQTSPAQHQEYARQQDPQVPEAPAAPTIFHENRGLIHQAEGLRDPFTLLQGVTRNNDMIHKSPLSAPDPDRSRHPLEAFDLIELKMVGFLQQDDLIKALIMDPSGIVHLVGKADYLGPNHGQVTRVDTASIQLRELVTHDAKTWTYRNRTLATR